MLAALDRTVANTVEHPSRELSSSSSSKLLNVTAAFRQNNSTLVSKLAALGLPKECSALRTCVWMMALNHLPSDYLSWDGHLQKARNQYKAVLNSFMKEHNGDLVQANPLVFETINKDVYRTRPEVSFFTMSLWDERNELSREGATAKISDPQHHYDLVARVLFMLALNNKNLSYVQGMNEVCAVLYYTFAQDPLGSYEDVEADVFYCMTQLLATLLQDAFSVNMDHMPNGISFRIQSFDALLLKKDPQMHEYLHSVNIEPVHYALTWVLLLFAQEVRITECQRLWDSILNDVKTGNPCEEGEPFFNYLCVAVVCSLREELLGDDYVNAMNWLHRRPFLHGVESVLELANELRTPGYVVPRTEFRPSNRKEKRYSEISFSSYASSTTADSATSNDTLSPRCRRNVGSKASKSKDYTPLIVDRIVPNNERGDTHSNQLKAVDESWYECQEDNIGQSPRSRGRQHIAAKLVNNVASYKSLQRVKLWKM